MRIAILAIALLLAGCSAPDAFEECSRTGPASPPNALIRSPSPGQDGLAFSSFIEPDSQGVIQMHVSASPGPMSGFDKIRVGWADLMAGTIVDEAQGDWTDGPLALSTPWVQAGETGMRAFVEYINETAGRQSTLLYVHDYELNRDSCRIDAQATLDAWSAIELSIDRAASTITIDVSVPARGTLEFYDSSGAVQEQHGIDLGAGQSRAFQVEVPSTSSVEAVFSPEPETGLVTKWAQA